MFGEMLEKFLEDGTLSGEHKDEKISVIAGIHAKSGHEEEVRVLLHSLAEPSRQEAGCLQYHLLEDREVPGSFSTYEEWSSVQALHAHLSGTGARSVLAKAKPMLQREMELKVLRMLL